MAPSTADCLAGHLQPAIVGGGIFSALHVAQGFPLTPQLVGLNIGFLYAYGALTCPLEELSGRRSWTHNALAGGALGYIAFEQGLTGIPFGLERQFSMRRIPLATGAALVYGGLGGFLAIIQGKPL